MVSSRASAAGRRLRLAGRQRASALATWCKMETDLVAGGMLHRHQPLPAHLELQAPGARRRAGGLLRVAGQGDLAQLLGPAQRQILFMPQRPPVPAADRGARRRLNTSRFAAQIPGGPRLIRAAGGVPIARAGVIRSLTAAFLPDVFPPRWRPATSFRRVKSRCYPHAFRKYTGR